MSEVGALVVRLQAETAQFRSDLGKVKGQLNELKDGAGQAGEGIAGSMGHSREAVRLLGEEFGVHMPRALATLISELGGVGEIMAMAFPVIGLVAALEVVAKLIEAHEKLALATQHSSDETENMAVKLGDQTKGLELSGMKLDDQIAKLEGRPSKNHLAEALLETSIAADKLAQEFASDFQKIDEAVMTASGTTHRWWEALKDNLSQLPALLTGGGLGMGATVAADAITTQDALKKVSDAIGDVEDMRLKMEQAAPGSEAEKNAQMFLIASYKELATAATAARSQILGTDEASIQEKAKLTQAILTATSAQKDFAIQEANAAKERKIGSLQDSAEDKPGQASALEDAKKLADAQYQISIDSAKQTFEQGKSTLAQEISAEKDAVDKKLASDIAYYEGKKKLAGTTAAQIKSLTTEETLAVMKASQDKQKFDEDYYKAVEAQDKELVNAEGSLWELQAKDQIAAEQEAADGVLKAAQAGAQQQLEMERKIVQDQSVLHRMSASQEASAEIAFVQAEINAEIKGYQNRIDALDKFDKDYLKKVQDFQNHIIELTQKGATQTWQIQHDADQKQLMDVQQAENKMYEAVANSVAKSIVEGKSLSASMRQVGAEMEEGMIRNLIMMMLTHDKQKLISAEGAFEKSYDWASAWGGPVAGAIAGATSFAAVMAFEQGGTIPGAGAIPIIGHGGETVVTKALTDRVERSERNGGTGGDTHVHNHFNINANAMDAEGMDKVLMKHQSTIQRNKRS
jgi:hypothetical protein